MTPDVGPATAIVLHRARHVAAGASASVFLPVTIFDPLGANAAEEDTASAEDASAAPEEAEEPVGPSKVDLPALGKSGPRSSWFVWGGSAALVGLFIAGVAYDLSHEKSAAEEEEQPPLPYFPNTP